MMNAFSRWKRSARNVPALTIAFSSRCVAEMLPHVDRDFARGADEANSTRVEHPQERCLSRE
jgi:hypothetical protein